MVPGVKYAREAVSVTHCAGKVGGAVTPTEFVAITVKAPFRFAIFIIVDHSVLGALPLLVLARESKSVDLIKCYSSRLSSWLSITVLEE